MKKLLSIFVLWSLVSFGQDKKISQLTPLPSVNGTELIPVAKSGANYYMSSNQLKTFIGQFDSTKFIPRAGTYSTYPLYGPIEFSTGTTALWQNSSTGSGFYLGSGNNSDLSSATNSGRAFFNRAEAKIESIDSSGAFGIVDVTPTNILIQTKSGTLELDGGSSPSTKSRFILSPNSAVIRGGTSFAGIQEYADYSANYTSLSHINKGYADGRYAPISGGAYLSSTLNAGKIYVGNGSNVGTAVTPSLSATPGTFSLATTGAFTFPDAATGTRGLLNSTDWDTFNNKQSALSGTGFVYQSGSTTSYSATIPNSALTNSTFTVNGTGMALGTSSTITARTTNALTAGTGLAFNSGTTFDGSAAKTLSIDNTVATLTGTQTLTNKTITSPTLNLGNTNPTANGSIGYDQTLKNITVGDGTNTSLIGLGSFTTYTPTFGGFSTNPASVVARYTIIGKRCDVWVTPNTDGVSNATNFTITLPFAAANTGSNNQVFVVRIENSGTYGTGLLVVVSNSNIANVFANTAGGAFTASGNKNVQFYISYEIQ